MKTTFLLSSQTPFADLMLHPEKVDAVLKAVRKTKAHASPAMTSGRSLGQHAKSRMTETR